MPTISDLSDLFHEMLKDVYYAEKKVLKSLPKMAKAVGKDSKLSEAFQTHFEETQGQVMRLEKVFAIIGEKPKAKKCDAIEGIAAEADELMKDVDCDCTMSAGLLAGAQAVEHYEIARYGTLIAWAKVLGYNAAVPLLEQTLEEEKKTDQLLTKLSKPINQDALDAMSDTDEEQDEAA